MYPIPRFPLVSRLFSVHVYFGYVALPKTFFRGEACHLGHPEAAATGDRRTRRGAGDVTRHNI